MLVAAGISAAKASLQLNHGIGAKRQHVFDTDGR